MSAASLGGPDFIAFIVKDVDAASRFWIDVVGLKPSSHSPPGARLFETNSIPFAVRTPYPGETAGTANGVSIWFSVAGNVDEYRELLVHRGADAGEARDGPFGRMFTLRSPEGFTVTVHASRTAIA